MSQKRHQEDGKLRADESSSSEEKRRRVPTFRNVVLEVMKIQSVQNLLEPILEPLIRRVVKEEVESALRKHVTNMKRTYGTEIHPTEVRSLQLQFLNSISLPVFTGTRIEGDDSSSLKIALVDAFTGEIIDSGPESSAKVEVIVLEGDFDGDERDDWTQEEFRSFIVREREGKKPLLTGDVSLNLKEGIGLVGEISFTDNSSWTRSRKFRLSARIGDKVDGLRIKEAKTESFIVRDHRGELYKKHHPPSLLDEVWRLEKIGKDGAFHKRLSQENIKTVKDFLTLLFIDATRLRNILGTGMSAKMWEVTLEHAQTCQLDKRLYLYWSPGSQQKSGLVFNVVGQVLGVLSENHYVPVENLSETEKANAHDLVISAFHHWEEVISFDEETSLTNGSLQLTNFLYPSSSTTTESSNCNQLSASTSHRIGGFDYTHPVVGTPNILSSLYPAGGFSGLVDDYPLHNIDNIGLRFDQSLNFPGELPHSLTQAFCDDEHLRFFDIDSSPQPQNPNLGSQAAVSNIVYTRSGDKAQCRWTKISSVLKWFTIRKKVALRKTQVPETQRYS